MSTLTITALLHGPDQPGLVSRVSSWIFLRGSNIVHADQHEDGGAGIFFQRVEWAGTEQQRKKLRASGLLLQKNST